MKRFLHSVIVCMLGLGLFLWMGEVWAAEKAIVCGAATEAISFDPYFANEAATNGMNKNIYDTLMENDADLQTRPALAEKWEMADDVTWVFHLRNDVKFHDGQPLTADDVKFSLERCANWPKSMHKVGTSQIKSIEVVNPLTIKVTTNKPFGILDRGLANIMIMSKAYVEKNGDDHQATKPNGTGSYKLAEYVKGDHITLVANENCWRGAPKVKKITVRSLTNQAARTAALLSGEVDFMDGLPVQNVEMIKAKGAYDVVTRPSIRVIFLEFDLARDASPKIVSPTGKNPFKDARVRRAVYLGINEDAIVKHVMNDFALATGALWTKEIFPFDPSVKRLPYDPQKAKELLKEAGYSDGFEVTLDAPNDRYVNDAQIAQAIAADLAKIGIKVKVNAIPKATFFPMVARAETSFCLYGNACPTGDANEFLDNFAHTFDNPPGWAAYNHGRYSNPKIDELIQVAAASVRPEVRSKVMLEAQRILLDDTVFIPLHQQVNLWAKAKKVTWKPRADEYALYREFDVTP
jgi:peptide/nickel transport system substrate-binding protein